MELRLSKETIALPSEFEVDERKKLVNDILNKYPEEFVYNEKMFDTKYGKSIDTNKNVKVKLDILATYLIMGVEIVDKEIMTRYKENNRPHQEMSFSQFGDVVPDANGWF